MLKANLKIIVADDHPIMLNGLVEELKSIGYQHLIKCSNGQKVIDFLEDNSIDLVILDILMPEKSGLDVARYIKNNKLDTKIIFYTYHSENSYINMAQVIGVDGYLLKEDTVEELNSCIINIFKGLKYYSKSILQDQLNKENDIQENINLLTQSEKIILKYISQSKSTKEISALRNVSKRTVEKQRASIKSKLLIEQSLSDWAVQQKYMIESI